MSKLLEQLTELDKKRIHNFITTWGCSDEDFIGVDEYLEQWAKRNTKLYHILGNQISVSMPFEYEKELSEIIDDCEEKLARHPWFILFKRYMRNEFPDADCHLGWSIFEAVHNYRNLANNEFSVSFKTKNIKTNGTLQIQKGAKYIKVMNKIYDADPEGFEKSYLAISEREEFHYSEYIGKTIPELKQDFINKHSAILNDKKISCTLTISIHPLDYITMSDNGNDWESCMSWKHDGCYHQGTVEMMNSNMVLCCFLHNEKTPWNFSRENKAMHHEDSEEDWMWNNKKYRQLIYITKDIIVSGKSYPYSNDEISQKIITAVKDLALKNMQWTYSFGPERYLDMKWINGTKSMVRAKGFARRHEEIKHNVIIETNAMYNDFVRDSGRHYWCYRNKVQHTKVINASGPATCLCCRNSVTELDREDWGDYFDRFNHTSMVICSDCRPKMECDYCNNIIIGKKFKLINKKDNKLKTYCINCIHHQFAMCHCCGNWHLINDSPRRQGVAMLSTNVSEKEELKDFHFSSCFSDYRWITSYKDIDRIGIFIPLCKECLNKEIDNGNIETITITNCWGSRYDYPFVVGRRDLTEEEFLGWRAKIDALPKENSVYFDF